MFGGEQARVARKARSPRSSPYTAPGESTLSQILRLLACSVEQARPDSPCFHLSLSYRETRNINQPHQCGGTEDKALSPIQQDLFGCSNYCSLSLITFSPCLLARGCLALFLCRLLLILCGSLPQSFLLRRPLRRLFSLPSARPLIWLPHLSRVCDVKFVPFPPMVCFVYFQ